MSTLSCTDPGMDQDYREYPSDKQVLTKKKKIEVCNTMGADGKRVTLDGLD